MNETLMSLLFKLDSICGLDFGVRGCRKAVIRKVIALQERIDAIVAADLEVNGENADRETKIRVCVETDNSNKPDYLIDPTDSPQNSGDFGGNIDSGENFEDVSRVERNDEEAGIIDVGVDCEVLVSESNGSCANGVHEDLDLVAEGVKEGDEKGKNGSGINAEKEGNGLDDNKRNRELLERMMEENEKMVRLMTRLFERNEMQMRMLNALTHRVELLEKAVVCDRLRKKKKAKAMSQCKQN